MLKDSSASTRCFSRPKAWARESINSGKPPSSGTIILTDYDEGQYELLRGLPAIMVKNERYDMVTKSWLEKTVQEIHKHNSDAEHKYKYNAMKAFKPYWWHKLQTGESELEASVRAGLSYPVLVGD